MDGKAAPAAAPTVIPATARPNSRLFILIQVTPGPLATGTSHALQSVSNAMLVRLDPAGWLRAAGARSSRSLLEVRRFGRFAQLWRHRDARYRRGCPQKRRRFLLAPGRLPGHLPAG